MADEIKLFRYVQKFYRITGIYPSKTSHHHPFNVKNSFSLVSLICLFMSTFGYFLFKASTIDEYGKCFYASFSMLEILLYFIVNFSKMQSILKLIKKLEDFVEMSEYSFYKSNTIFYRNLMNMCYFTNRSPKFDINHYIRKTKSKN